MERIYHRYENWECFKNGFFKNVSGSEKEVLSKKVIELFSDSKLTELYMQKVVSEWPFSSEHNLSNNSMNRVAWLGQAACCIYAGIPFKITMENWRFVDEKKQIKACEIAQKIITKYESKNKQLCLNII